MSKGKTLSAALAAALMFSVMTASPSAVRADPFADENFSATVWFTSDYIFRGVSFSDSDPAIQASFDWGYNNFYAGVWGSNLELTGYNKDGTSPANATATVDGLPDIPVSSAGDGSSSIEYDFYVGYANSIGPIDYDATLIYYWFPNDRGGAEADVFEVWLSLSHTFANLPLTPTVGVFGAWSPDATLEDGDSTYIKGSVALALTEHFGLDFAVGALDVEGDKSTDEGGGFCVPGHAIYGHTCDGYGYTHYEVGLTTSLKGFNFDLRYHDTNEQRSHLAFFNDVNDALEERIVFTASRSF